jgi:adenosylmethionine-8-amino-7-oxononanoate aminotransferase
MADRLAHGLLPLVEHPNVGDIRQHGLMVGIELVKDRKTKEAFPYAARMGHKVALAGRKRELMLRPLGNVIVLMPPLSISPAEIDFLAEHVRESITDALATA